MHFRRKEIEIYPDTTKKHTRGEGLNKKAQVTLDMVYPIDKTTKQPITVSLLDCPTDRRRCRR